MGWIYKGPFNQNGTGFKSLAPFPCKDEDAKRRNATAKSPGTPNASLCPVTALGADVPEAMQTAGFNHCSISDHPDAFPGARCSGGSICCWLAQPFFFGASALKKEPTLDSARSTQKGPRTHG